MKILSVALFFSLSALMFSTNAFAENPIAKCVDVHGDLTFTDYLCVTDEQGSNPLLMTEKAINPSVRARIPSVIKADTIAANKIRSATSEARNECSQKFVKYFRKKHPSISTIPDIEFTDVVDQYIKGANVSISLSGPVKYVDNTYAVNSNIECTVQRFKSTSEWLVGYRER